MSANNSSLQILGSPNPDSVLQWAMGAFTSLSLVVLLVFGGAPAHAQVQIEQVSDVASKIEGVTGGQLTAVVGEEAEGVTRDDVLGLTGAPALPGTDGVGSSAVVEQSGNSNAATVTQNGEAHEASVAQLGNRNDVSITQGPLSGFGGRLPSGAGVGATTGADNVAVTVQDGSDNTTTIQQYGGQNTAGVRFEGSSNAMELLQVGQGNGYLLDHSGSGVDLTGDRRIEQFGNNNLLRQDTGSPVSVQMRGSGIRMEITQN